MTAPDVVKLGRRAVACRAWRWVPGMLSDNGYRILGDDEYPATVPDSTDTNEHGGFSGGSGNSHLYAPDMTDPATLGCLLALVREAWGEPTLSAAWAARRWYIVTPVRGVGFDALKAIDSPDELSALVAALEAAPVRS